MPTDPDILKQGVVTSEAATRDVVERFIDALDRRDFEAVSRLLDRARFRFVGPLGDFDDVDLFCSEFARIEPILKRVERRRLFVDGDEAMAVYNIVTTVPGLEFTRIAEWFTVRRGLIADLEIFFDTHAYNRMFDL